MESTSSPKNTVLLGLAAAILIAMLVLGPGTAAAEWKLNDSNGTFSLGDQPSGIVGPQNVDTSSGFSETFSNPAAEITTTPTSVTGDGGVAATVSYKESIKELENAGKIESIITQDIMLQEMLKEALGLKELTKEKISEIAAASAEVAKSISSSRSISIVSGKTTFSLSFTYGGSGSVSNFIIYDTVPKSVAQSSDNITVTAGGAIVKIVEKDPKYSFIYPAISGGDSKTVSYTVNRQLDKSVVNTFAAPVFLAEKVVKAPGTPAPATPPAGEKKEEIPPGAPQKYGWKTILAVIAAILIIAAILKAFGKGKKQKNKE